MRLKITFLWVTFWLLAVVVPSQAHGYLIRAIPADRAPLDRSPTRLQYWFSEDLEPRFSTLILRDALGNVIAEGGVDDNTRSLLRLQLPPNALMDGAYVAELRTAFSSDGHAVTQTQVFFVGESAGTLTSISASDQPQPLEIVWKVLWQSGVFVMFGVTMLYAFVLVQAWGNARYVAGELPPRVMSRLNGVLWGGLIVAIVGHVLALLQQSMAFFNVGLSEVLAGNLWEIVRIGSRFGDVWNARTFFLGVMVALQLANAYYGRTYPRTVRGFWGASLWGVALLIGTQAVTSHASGSLIMAWVGVAVHWLHTLATAFWVGGLVVLLWVLPVALAPYADDQRITAFKAVMLRYSGLMVGTVAVVISTGIYSSSNWFFEPQDLNSTYGRTLGLKVLLTAIVLALGAVHHWALRPATAPRLGQVLAQFALGRTLRLEAVLAVGVLGLASTLSATPIPQPAFLQRETPPTVAISQANGYEGTLTIAPASVGVNTYDLLLLSRGELVEGAAVTLQWVAPERDKRGRFLPAEMLESGLYVASSADIDALGTWWALADVAHNDTVTRLAFSFSVTPENSVATALPAGVHHVLLAFGVLGAFGFVLLPAMRGVYAQLNLAPQSLLVAGGVTVISLVFMGIGIVQVNNDTLATLQAQNPPPSVVNPILPDQRSLEIGETRYFEQCLVWQSSTEFQAFVRGLETFRDEALYQALLEGWRRMPPCSGEIAGDDRWHVVNYARTLYRQYVKP